MDYGAFIVNMTAAMLLGMAIGVERQWSRHTAGIRTNALVALGAALFVGLSTLIERDASPSRIAAQVVSGLGFLGGGVILREGLNVRGLTTAATIWCSGAVGALSGAGFPLYALLGTVGILVVNFGFRPLTFWLDARSRAADDSDVIYRLRVESTAQSDAQVRHLLMRHVEEQERLTLQGIATEEGEGGRSVVVASVYAEQRDDGALETIVARLSGEPEVSAVSWKRSAE